MMTAASRNPARNATRNPRVISTLVFVFLAGALAGALSMQFGLHDRLHRTVTAATKPASPANDILLPRLKANLNLSEEQSQAIAAVLADYRSYYMNLQEQLDDVRSTGRMRIVEVLTDEQKQKFEKLVGELQPPAPAK